MRHCAIAFSYFLFGAECRNHWHRIGILSIETKSTCSKTCQNIYAREKFENQVRSKKQGANGAKSNKTMAESAK
jgi:hypothetical protein